jgi:hypothetical protein
LGEPARLGEEMIEMHKNPMPSRIETSPKILRAYSASRSAYLQGTQFLEVLGLHLISIHVPNRNAFRADNSHNILCADSMSV